MTLLVTTTMTLEGYKIVQYKGVVRGIVVRSPTIMQGILGGLRNILGGNIQEFTQMCEQGRQQAYDLMVEHAQALGANAVIGLHYAGSELSFGRDSSSASEILCYGTAVVVEEMK